MFRSVVTSSILAVSCFVLVACATGSPPSGDNPGDGADAGMNPGSDGSVPPGPDGGGAEARAVTLTEPTSVDVTPGNSIGCLDPNVDVHLETSFFRTFDLVAHGVTRDLAIEHVEVGIENATGGAGGAQPATVSVYTLSGAFTMANLTQIGTTSTSLPDMTLGLHGVDLPAEAPAASTVVVELFYPDGTTGNNAVLIGSNDSGEGSPTFIRAEGCGFTEPTAMSSPQIGRPSQHWVVRVHGVEAAAN